MIKHIAFTMYTVKDMPRARKFYESDLGLKVTNNFRDEWVEYHLDNGCFAITTMVPQIGAGASIAFEVEDVDKVIERLKKGKVTVKREPFSSPVCRMAVVLDTEGNAVTLHTKTR
ncbi:MAG: VOC family protein [Elusimicrobia bacterium]|nr:VOC family protein [Elusimicrobiota bacterium]